MKKTFFLLSILFFSTVSLLGCRNEPETAEIEPAEAASDSPTAAAEPQIRPYVPYTEMKKLWADYTSASLISDYDVIIRALSQSEGYDWRLIAAIAYTESQFDENITSGAGARGLMQIMPVVARQFGVPAEEIADPRTNVWLGIELLNYINDNMHFNAGTSEHDRLCIVLAAYNCGMGHVQDARRLARKDGHNPDSWKEVARYLKLKFNPEYYMDEAVRHGQFEDSDQTLAFVGKVLRRYDNYCTRAAL